MELCEKELCTGCGVCIIKCPKKCISFSVDNEGFQYPKVDYTKCIKCGICFKICPVNIKPIEGVVQGVYGGKNAIDEERIKSSSGGIFSVIAKEILMKSGVVYAVCQDKKDFEVKHIAIESYSEIDKVRKSKYIQSELGNTFVKILSDLNKDRTVLFVGTPCQVAGLKKLVPNNKNLYTIDFICHGVPSQFVWNKYLEAQEKVFKSRITEVHWRDKKQGWQGCYNRIVFKNGKEYIANVVTDPFLRSFNESLFLRKVCYKCPFKGLNRSADITLADLWGVNNFAPTENDDGGISSILINNDKGKRIFENIQEKISYFSVDIENILKYNSQIFKTAKNNNNRNKFFKCLLDSNFMVAYKKHGPTGLIYTFKKKIKYYLSYFEK